MLEAPSLRRHSRCRIEWRDDRPVRPGPGVIGQLLNPSEPPLPDATGLIDITVEYPDRPFTVAGWNIGWSGVYLLLTLIFAFALKGLFGVTL